MLALGDALGRTRSAAWPGPDRTDRRRSAEAGFDAHLVKPIVGEDVLRLTRTS